MFEFQAQAVLSDRIMFTHSATGMLATVTLFSRSAVGYSVTQCKTCQWVFRLGWLSLLPSCYKQSWQNSTNFVSLCGVSRGSEPPKSSEVEEQAFAGSGPFCPARKKRSSSVVTKQLRISSSSCAVRSNHVYALRHVGYFVQPPRHNTSRVISKMLHNEF